MIVASQELSSIVEVNDLCNTLLSSVLKSVGATKGVLVLEKDEKLVINSIIKVKHDKLHISHDSNFLPYLMLILLVPIALESNCPYASSSIINYCWRTNKTLNVTDAKIEEPFSK